MNNQQTIEKLNQMRLVAMAQMHHQHVKNNQYRECTPDEYLALLTEHEWEHRYSRKIKRLVQQAGFRQKASVEEVSYVEARNLEKNMFQRLASLDFINRKENLILTGPSGVGKSYLAQALGHQACIMEKKVAYSPTARLFNRLKLSKVDGTYLREIKKLNKAELLILDDFGLQAFDNFARDTLMDIIDERYRQSSTIVSSQLPVSAWYDIIGEGTIADAILDRLVNSSHRIDLKGESLRKGILKNE
ncbi:MAG: IS21-like element helper ATPase IstB [Schleiferiaceae bacterium]|nr:IS21-like element helper ATPase IstB [Schleiferiaceae bacterium]